VFTVSKEIDGEEITPRGINPKNNSKSIYSSTALVQLYGYKLIPEFKSN
jgi:hypothetical protein